MNHARETTEFEAFRKTDLHWAAPLQDIWQEPDGDVPELHGKIRQEFRERLAWLQTHRRRSPLGWFLIGSGGIGKTHLLGAMRREAAHQGAGFVLVDMTDVRDFWDVVLQGYLDSLQSIYLDGKFQYEVLLYQFISLFGREAAKHNLALLARRKTTALSEDVKRIIGFLRRRNPRQALEYQDALLALICLNSADAEIAASGYSWLQGQELDEKLAHDLGFSKSRKRSIEIVRALSWFMSLSGPTILAFDQLDPIVQQVRHQNTGTARHSSDEVGTALTIIEQIGAGLGALHDTTFNTLTVVSCVETTLDLLKQFVFSTYLDRFEEPRRLLRPGNADILRRLIGQRLGTTYRVANFQPPYVTWPFHPSAIDEFTNESPREVLKLCEQHRKACLEAGKVIELRHFQKQAAIPEVASRTVPSENRFQRLDDQFQRYRRDAAPEALLEEKYEDERLAPLYQTALVCLIREHESRIPPFLETIVEHDFSGGMTTKPLHARLRIIDHAQDSRESHYCVRAIQRRHHGAFQARLKAAMTQSGIDRALKFRHLVIVRSCELPSGEQTKALTRTFQEAGGSFHRPTEEELRSLAALARMSDERDPLWDEWLQHRRPVSQLGLGEALTFGWQVISPSPGELGDFSPADSEPQSIAPSESPLPTDPPIHLPAAQLRLGRKMMGRGTLGDEVSLPLTFLSTHTIVFGGSGSGKSVTLRRIVEEAVLAGIPSIVIDSARDMCFFDQTWPEPPGGWQEGDAERSQQFRTKGEQVVWTPIERSSGNLFLDEHGSRLDAAVLFGDDRPRATVRVSVIRLTKLKGQNAAQGFLNQLASELLSWIQQNPSPPNSRLLRGLLVIDEARDFVPSQKSTECKEILLRLAVQARKFGLGLVLATRYPMDIETEFVENCATHLYGLSNSPASLETIQDLMAQRGGSGHDIPKLKAGQFYLHHDDAEFGASLKIQVPMSLSRSPSSPMA